MQIKTDVKVTAKTGTYDTETVIEQLTDRTVAELEPKVNLATATTADVETLRDVLAQQLRDLGKEMNRQLDLIAERVAARERAERAEQARAEQEKVASPSF